MIIGKMVAGSQLTAINIMNLLLVLFMVIVVKIVILMQVKKEVRQKEN